MPEGIVAMSSPGSVIVIELREDDEKKKRKSIRGGRA